MSFFLNEPSLDQAKLEAYKICRDFLAGPWEEISLEEFQFSQVSGGLSNILYHCSLPKNAITDDSKAPKEVLYRLYGPLQDEAEMIVSEAATFMLLSERKLGPRLYGVFCKGRLEEFIPSRSLKTFDYRLLAREIGIEMAKIHALEVPIRKNNTFMKACMEKWLNEAQAKHLEKHNKVFPLLEVYLEEMGWLEREMKKTKSPIVYCHNDLQGGNILLREGSMEAGKPSLMLIDFEFGAYHYRGFDIANQFCEWCFDYALEEFPHFTVDFDKFPNREEQVVYIDAYLNQLVKEGVIDSDAISKEREAILEEVKVFAMTAHIYWSLWSEKMAFQTSVYFAHKEHGKARWNGYYKFKEAYLRSRDCNGETNQNSH